MHFSPPHVRSHCASTGGIAARPAEHRSSRPGSLHTATEPHWVACATRPATGSSLAHHCGAVRLLRLATREVLLPGLCCRVRYTLSSFSGGVERLTPGSGQDRADRDWPCGRPSCFDRQQGKSLRIPSRQRSIEPVIRLISSLLLPSSRKAGETLPPEVRPASSASRRLWLILPRSTCLPLA